MEPVDAISLYAIPNYLLRVDVQQQSLFDRFSQHAHNRLGPNQSDFGKTRESDRTVWCDGPDGPVFQKQKVRL